MEKQYISIIQKLSISYECALAIGNRLNLGEMLQEVIHTVVHKTNAHRGSIWVRGKEGQDKIILGARSGSRLSREEIKKRAVFFQDVFEEAWVNGEVLRKYWDEKDFLQYCNVIAGKEQAVLIVPIKNIAILHLVYSSREMADETLGNILLGLSQKLYVAIEACLAHENMIDNLSKIRRGESIQSVLFHIADAVNTTKDLSELSDSIRGYLGQVIDTTNFYVALYDKETDTITLPFMVDEMDTFASFPVGKTMTGYVIRTNRPLLATEKVIETLIQSGEVEIVGTLAKVWLGVPLRLDKKIYGVVVVQSYTDAYQYTEKDRDILVFVSDQIAVAIARKRAEEALVAEKERLNVTLRSIGDGVITTDTKGQIITMNKVAEEITGWVQGDSVGKPLDTIFNIFHEKTRIRCKNPFQIVMETGEVMELSQYTLLITRDGSEKMIADSAAPIRDNDNRIIGVVLVFRDVTEERKMAEELLKTSKLESIAILAGGIAHDFNNILTGIMGNLSLAKLQTPSDNDIFSFLTEMEKASVQAKTLTQQLLTFSKGGAPVTEVTSIVDLIKDFTIFALRGSNVKCEFFIPDDLWSVNIDEGQISQVVHNVIINADQSMPEGGVIKVFAENIVFGAKQTLPLTPGKYVKICIEDHGVGIPAKYLQKIFDPYFTTKQKGSGLGLALAYSIIKGHHGLITVESEVRNGTTFHIFLPASEKEPKKKEEKRKGDLIIEKGKILIMDDEEIVRNVLCEMLVHMGWEAEFAKDGEEALKQYREALESGVPFDVVILDLTVPGGIGGKEAIKKLVEIDPAVKAIVSSGYSDDPIMAQFMDHGFVGVVRKPYRIQELRDVLHKVI